MATAKPDISFGVFVKQKRERLGKSVRGLASEIGITPAYLSDIERNNRKSPENFLKKMIEVLEISGDDVDTFYDLAGQSRNNNYPDLSDYIGSTPIARVALRKARDLEISDSQWEEFIKGIDRSK